MPKYYLHSSIIKRENRKVLFLSTFSSGILIFVLFLGLYVYNGYKTGQTPDTILSPLGKPIIKVVRDIVDIFSPINSLAINDFGTDFGSYGIYVKNLKTKQIYTNLEDKEFMSASLYKLWVMGTTFQQITNGKLTKDQLVAGGESSLDKTLDYSTNTSVLGDSTNAENENIVTYTVGSAIESMITVSDNYAALLLSSRDGNANVVNFLNNYGLTDSSFGSPPKTTAKDIAEILEDIYEGKVVNKEVSREMLDILKRQKINDRIPKYLPPDVQVAHKTGELDYVKHDAGIVFTKRGDYIIVVLSETKNPKIAAEKIAVFSKDVYDYFDTTTN